MTIALDKAKEWKSSAIFHFSKACWLTSLCPIRKHSAAMALRKRNTQRYLFLNYFKCHNWQNTDCAMELQIPWEELTSNDVNLQWKDKNNRFLKTTLHEQDISVVPHYEQTLKKKISSASLDNGDYCYCDI